MLDDLSQWQEVWKNTIELGLFTPTVDGAKTLPVKVTKKQREIPAH